MIPLWSSERTYTKPTATLFIILLNVAVFFFELTLPSYPPGYREPGISLNSFIEAYGLVPDRFQFSSLLTSMFLHGGWLHIIGNMWFLWVFGKGIEDILGHGRFLLFYLICGMLAGLVQVFTNPFSPVPTIGASGAIAGVMGAYLVKFPRASIATLVPILIIFMRFDIPAAFVLLFWFVLQVFSGVGSFGYSTISEGDVAWFAHVGGFLAGMVLVLIMPTQPRYRRVFYY